MKTVLKLKLHLQRANDRGFTLLEAMIATMVLAVGILAVAQMQLTALHGNSRAQTITELKGWTTDQFETMISQPDAYEKSPLLTDNNPNHAVGTVHTTGLPPLPYGYAVTWTVRQDYIFTGVKLITVTMSGQRFGQAKNVTFEYIM